MCNSERHERRRRRRQFFERSQGPGLTLYSAGPLSKRVLADKPKNDEKGRCLRCSKLKRIKSKGLCTTCYDKETKSGNCKKCSNRGVLTNGLCDNCFRDKNSVGRCRICGQEAELRSGLCATKCYKKWAYKGVCRECSEEDVLSNGLCQKCWNYENRRGNCKKCGDEGQLTTGLCDKCYRKKNYGDADGPVGTCKNEDCDKEGPLKDGYCRTCYDKEHYSGMCDSCGDFGVLVGGYCRSCHDHEDEMRPCKKCGNKARLDHNEHCGKCLKNGGGMGICRVCGRERALVFANMCLECYDDKSEGINHYMKSSIKKILERILGKDNFRKEVLEIHLEGEKDPFIPDFELKNLNGKWCPAQYFNSREEWVAKHKNIMDFRDFYKEYLQKHNYIMFTPDTSRPDAIKKYLMDRGFLQPNGLPHGKKVTKRKKPISKRKV